LSFTLICLIPVLAFIGTIPSTNIVPQDNIRVTNKGTIHGTRISNNRYQIST